MSKKKSTTPTTALVTALVTALALALAGCGSENAEGTSPSAGKPSAITLGLSISDLDTPFFAELLAGAQAEAKAQGVSLRVRDARDEVSRQRQHLLEFTEQSLDAVVINAVDAVKAAPGVKDIGNAGIPVIAADRMIDSSAVVSTVASDNVPGGQLAAEALAEELEGEGTVVVLRGGPGISASRDRGKGFTDGLKKYPDIKIVNTKVAGFDRDEGERAMAGLLAAHPDLSGVFAENDEMALGALKALGSKAGNDGDKVRVVGFDGTPAGLRAIETGTLAGSVAQQPKELGKVAVRNAVRAARGEPVDAEILVPVRVVNSRNISEFS
ncbi:substrate-binding domain-containing protein [Streptomyces gobiensis]|uniref:substrate-binding domain-containing protein n=1 Tax=Streptomyces gobiensis TaxID=2875706 RepID=UPI001E46AD5E|nr:substrate-binding domain-containing protein [Streptomyces gobiensis]UGY91528.1 substrate-binding domain-containing protein [Streptomyces gobiensis]